MSEHDHPNKWEFTAAAGAAVTAAVYAASRVIAQRRRLQHLLESPAEEFEFRKKAAVLGDTALKNHHDINELAAVMGLVGEITVGDVRVLIAGSMDGKSRTNVSKALVPLVRNGIVHVESPDGARGKLESLVLHADDEFYNKLYVLADDYPPFQHYTQLWRERLLPLTDSS